MLSADPQDPHNRQKDRQKHTGQGHHFRHAPLHLLNTVTFRYTAVVSPLEELALLEHGNDGGCCACFELASTRRQPR